MKKIILISVLIIITGCIYDKENSKDEKIIDSPTEKIVGADISFVDQEEYWKVNFFDEGSKKDSLDIFAEHGFNYIRLRVFVDPNSNGGYKSYNVLRKQEEEFCGLERTIDFAKRVKEKGLKLLIDLHYSDTWADPGNQQKPVAWQGLELSELKDKMYDYTSQTIEEFKKAEIDIDMIQIGNEITGGFLWDTGRISNKENFKQLLEKGILAVRNNSPETKIMLHTTADDVTSWLEKIDHNELDFDIIGLSYYPQHHGTTEDLEVRVEDISKEYDYDIVIAEYSKHKEEVNDIIFSVPEGLGAFIWEPVNFKSDGAENLFYWESGDKEGHHTNDLMDFYLGF
ncbi:MAG: glycosyl hydrolase 53 family protein [Fusobacteriota bacterium]